MLYVRKVPQNECWGKKSRRHKTMGQGPHLTPGLFVCFLIKFYCSMVAFAYMTSTVVLMYQQRPSILKA